MSKIPDVIKEAEELGVLEQSGIYLLNQYLTECEQEIKKNNDQLQRLLGRNDQLTLNKSMLIQIINKNVIKQKQVDAEHKRREDALNKAKMEEAPLDLAKVEDDSPKKVKKSTKSLGK